MLSAHYHNFSENLKKWSFRNQHILAHILSLWATWYSEKNYFLDHPNREFAQLTFTFTFYIFASHDHVIALSEITIVIVFTCFKLETRKVIYALRFGIWTSFINIWTKINGSWAISDCSWSFQLHFWTRQIVPTTRKAFMNVRCQKGSKRSFNVFLNHRPKLFQVY